MECKRVLKLLNEYVDDSLSWREAQTLEKHLGSCSECARELHEIRSLQHVMRSLGRREAPEGLDLRMKILASKQTDAWIPAAAINRLKDSLQPFAIPAVSGVVLTCLFFIPLLGIFFTGANLNASGTDIPSGLFTEPRPNCCIVRSSLETFQKVKEPITLEAEVRQDGTVRNYTVLKGPNDRRR